MFTSDSGIYSIINIINGKKYIGSAVNLKNRINEHKRKLKNNIHHSTKLQNSWNKHGRQYFIFDVVEIVPDKDNLIEREQFWIDMCDSCKNGYNVNPTAGSSLGAKQTEDTKAKISASNKVRVITAEARCNMSSAQKGKKHTEETKAKMSASRIGKIMPAETKARISAANIGKPKTDETKAKISASKMGHTYNIGWKHTDDTKLKMSEARSAYHSDKKLQSKIGYCDE